MAYIQPTMAPIKPMMAPIEPTTAPIELTMAPIKPATPPIKPTAPIKPRAPIIKLLALPGQCPSITSKDHLAAINGLIAVNRPPIDRPITEPRALIKPTMAPIEPTTAPIKPPMMAPTKPTRALIEPTMAPIEPPTMAPIEPTMAPIKPTTAPIKPTTAPIKLTCHSHFTSSKSVLLEISLVASSGNTSMLHLPQQVCSKGGAAFKHMPRPTQLKATKSIYANALAHTGTLTYANALAQTDSLKGFPIRWAHDTFLHAKSLALRFSLLDFSRFLFTSLMLPPQTPTLWPTQVPSWVSLYFFCIIGLTSMLLPQGCVDPLVSGDGQTISYQPHIHANTISSSREQHCCSHNL
jgi:hypothetical protein